MVFSREYPHSFGDALRVCRQILSGNRELVAKGLVDTESEQLVMGAHRIATGEKLDRARFFSRLQDRLSDAAAEKVLVFAGRRAEGELLQHILGFQAFHEHDYEVNSSTLVPRPETEALVREAITRLKNPALGFEVGAGAGVISIELLSAFSGLKMIATESSDEAIALSRKNASKILGPASRRLEMIKAVPPQVMEPFSGKTADFLISNPPYLDASLPEETDPEVLAHEPRSALFPSNGDPLYFYKKIAMCDSVSQIFLEIAAERADETFALFEAKWTSRIVPDLAGRPRILIAERKT